MKTTEIFVEQVLIGLLVIASGLIPYIKWDEFNLNWLTLGIGAGIVAIAYLLGIIFDRFADTLLSRIEKLNRLKFAIDIRKKDSNFDLFPEGYLRIKIRNKGSENVEWMDYLRSRIRLSRALAVFMPFLTLSGILSQKPKVIPDEFISMIMGIMAMIYILCFIFVLIVSSCKAWKLPKTYEKNIKKAIKKFSWWQEPLIIATFLLVCLAAYIIVYFTIKDPDSFHKTFVVLLMGSGISALSIWTWLRIYETFRKFLIGWKAVNNE